jgi:4-amino-4-deoxy-L-arabinose transferase-like glycosyltransferase
MNFRNLLNRPFLLFLPFLAGYGCFILLFHVDHLIGDEWRYLNYARNLLNGYFSPAYPDIQLVNGPGYPLFLVPFVALKFPLLAIRLVNALLYYLSVVLLYKSLRHLLSWQISLSVSIFWACYYVSFYNIRFVHSEAITYMLVSLFIYYLIRAFSPGRGRYGTRHIILSGMVLGGIALIKVAFIYVVFFLLAGTLILWAVHRRSGTYRNLSMMLGISFLTLLPYLIYCYVLTDRILYFNSNTGDTLYWMSSPYKGEYGDWQTDSNFFVDLEGFAPGKNDSLIAHHQVHLDRICGLPGMERDQEFKRVALENIKRHPWNYLENCFYNLGRLFFDYPYSYAVHDPSDLLVLLVQGILLTLILFSLVPSLLNFRGLPVTIRFLWLFSLLYLGESMLVSASLRIFTPVAPALLVCIGFIVQNMLRVKLRLDHEPDRSADHSRSSDAEGMEGHRKEGRH